MKYIKPVFCIFFLMGYIQTNAQRTNIKVVHGNGENIIKGETKSVLNPIKIIRLQVFKTHQEPFSKSWVLIEELGERYDCDSLGNVTFELPDSMLQSDAIHLTIIRRQRLNRTQIKLYRKKITVWLDDISENKKVVLSNFKIKRAYISGGGCPSF